MKSYCFNYAVAGLRTFLPIFICVEASNQLKAFGIAKRYIASINKDIKVKVWFKNFPEAINKEFQTRKVPKNFK